MTFAPATTYPYIAPDNLSTA